MFRYEANASPEPHGFGIGGGESQCGKRVEKIDFRIWKRHFAVLSIGIFRCILADQYDVLTGP